MNNIRTVRQGTINLLAIEIRRALKMDDAERAVIYGNVGLRLLIERYLDLTERPQ